MHMHATTGDGTLQKALIRKFTFVVQSWRGAGLDDDLA
jgi:hypothetical protein